MRVSQGEIASVPDAEVGRPEGLARERRMWRTILAALATRGGALVVVYATLPLLMPHLGSTRYGAWLTISSLSAWLGLAGMGLHPALVSLLSSAAAKGDRDSMSRVVSTAHAIASGLGLFVACLLVVSWLLAPGFRLPGFTGAVAEEARPALLVFGLAAAMQIPLSVVPAVQQSLQLGYLTHGWQAVALPVRYAAVVGVVALLGDLGLVAVALSFVPLLATVASGWHLYSRHAPWLRPDWRRYDPAVARALAVAGATFLGYSVVGLVVSGTDNLVLSWARGPASVPEYALCMMVVQAVIALQMIVLDASWPAYTEAAQRRDVAWLRATHRRIVASSVGAMVLTTVAAVLIGPWALSLLSQATTVPSRTLLVAIGLTGVIQSFFLCYGRLLTALGVFRLNVWTGALNAVVNLVASLALVGPLGGVGVAIGTSIGYLVSGWFLVARVRLELARLGADPA